MALKVLIVFFAFVFSNVCSSSQNEPESARNGTELAAVDGAIQPSQMIEQGIEQEISEELLEHPIESEVSELMDNEDLEDSNERTPASSISKITYENFKKGFPKIWSEGLGGDNSRYREPLPLQSTGSSCMGGDLLILDYSKLQITYDGKSYEQGPGMVGSAGGIIGVYSVKKDTQSGESEVSELFNNNVIDVKRVVGSGPCPDIEVTLTGIYFNRVGSDHGVAKLRFDEKRKTYEVVVN